MTPFARYVYLLDSLLAQRIPDEPEAKQEAARRMKREGMRINEIAGRFDVSRQTVRTWLKGHKPAFRHSKETKQRYSELRASGLSIRKACAELGLNRGTVEHWV